MSRIPSLDFVLLTVQTLDGAGGLSGWVERAESGENNGVPCSDFTLDRITDVVENLQGLVLGNLVSGSQLGG